MNEELFDLIILLQGNHLPFLIRKQDVEDIDALLLRSVRDTNADNKWLNITHGDRKGRVDVAMITGWYFRPRMIDPSTRAIGVMEKIEKKMTDESGGEDWKGK
jgi:hypothetical protein